MLTIRSPVAGVSKGLQMNTCSNIFHVQKQAADSQVVTHDSQSQIVVVSSTCTANRATLEICINWLLSHLTKGIFNELVPFAQRCISYFLGGGISKRISHQSLPYSV